jgi:hypothetical protein
MSDVESSRSDSIGAGAPGTEIEVTPEMVEAGVDVLSGFNTDFETLEGCVERIYIAMEKFNPMAPRRCSRQKV